MDNATRQHVRSYFEEALRLPPDSRRAWLLSRPGIDEATIHDVLSLLDSHEDANDFFAEIQTTPAHLEEPPGTVVGRFVLVRRIGEGGFGDIYLAEQHEPIRRQVALKILKPGMDSREVLKRFAAERHTLELLNHPNIARILDAGATAAGRPYFAMELVEGTRINRHCDELRLNIHARVELFLGVCAAVQHAHQQGVVHRDLKPSNVLVTVVDGKPVPKVIDFGIAKLLHHDNVMGTSLMTIKPHWLGTPAYMSPEQMLGNPVDTRSDLWSLGVLLHELLTGALPVDPTVLRDKPTDQIERTLQQVESTGMTRKLGNDSACAEARATTPVLLRRLLRGELEWIVGKCLRTRPDGRYPAVSSLADDLKSWIAGAPVSAAPPSWVYRARKAISQHRIAFVAAFSVLALLVVALIATSWSLRRERQHAIELERLQQQTEARRVEADNARKTAESINFFVNGIFRQANPQINTGWRRDFTVREAIDRVAGEISKLAGEPLAQAGVCDTISTAYSLLDEPEKALAIARIGLDARTKALGADHPDTLNSQYSVALALQSMRRDDEAIPMFAANREASTRLKGADSYEALTAGHSLGNSMIRLGRREEGVSVLSDVLERKRRALGPDHPSTSSTANVLGHTLLTLKRPTEAESIIQDALRIRRLVYGDDHPMTLAAASNLAAVEFELGRLAESESLSAVSLDRAAATLGVDHHLTRTLAMQWQRAMGALGRSAEAEKTLRDKGVTPATQPATQPATRSTTSPQA